MKVSKYICLLKKKKKERKEKNTAVVTVHLKSQIKCVVGSWVENENAVIIDD